MRYRPSYAYCISEWMLIKTILPRRHVGRYRDSGSYRTCGNGSFLAGRSLFGKARTTEKVGGSALPLSDIFFNIRFQATRMRFWAFRVRPCPTLFFPVLRNSKMIGRSRLETRRAGTQLLHFYAVRLVRMCLCYIPVNGVFKTREKSTLATRYKATEPCQQILFVRKRCSLPRYVQPGRPMLVNEASKKNMVVAVAFKFITKLRIMNACTFTLL